MPLILVHRAEDFKCMLQQWEKSDHKKSSVLEAVEVGCKLCEKMQLVGTESSVVSPGQNGK